MKPADILTNIDRMLESGENKWRLYDVCDELGIFDWWRDELSVSNLKSMRSFLNTAVRLGYTGYACFKVGAAGCAHGMWAFKKESTTGYSPDGECIFHSFRTGDNYYNYCDAKGKWNYEPLRDFKELSKAIAESND